MKPFLDHLALVTGGGTGIGRAIALALAAGGAKVLLVGRRVQSLDAVAAEIRGLGAEASVHPLDLTDDAAVRDVAVRALAATLDRTAGRLDVLVHSAAVLKVGSTAEASLDDFDLQYRTNVRGPYLLTQALLPALRRARGQIVFVNSSAGLQAGAGVGQYAATKHALRAVADSLREEMNREGVRVLSVYPGRTATPMQEHLHRLEGKPYRPERLLQAEDVAAMVVQALALPRTAEVTEIRIRPMCAPGAPEVST